MKKAIILFSALFAVHAFAAKVGDSVTLTGTITQGSMSIPAVQTMTVKSFDAASQKFKVVVDVTINGQKQTNESDAGAQDIGDEAQFQQVVANCEFANGVRETLQTSVGAIETCKLTQPAQNGGTEIINIGAVPFGAVRIENKMASGMNIVLTLSALTRGN